MESNIKSKCSCMNPPFDYRDFIATEVGVDMTEGRYADVTIETCRHCGSVWLRYLVEYEFFSQSGRWYRGLITADVADSVTPETAAKILEDLPWRFGGGSYFNSFGFRDTNPMRLGCF